MLKQMHVKLLLWTNGLLWHLELNAPLEALLIVVTSIDFSPGQAAGRPTPSVIV
jgi:hypothetical protein